MKFIHTADLHLDSKMEGFSTEKTKIRREEILCTFERLARFATENSVSAVIIAGDTFDTQRISVKTKNRVIEAIKNNPSVDFLFLSGNHDEDGFISGIDEVPENLKFFLDEWTYFEYGKVVIGGVKITPSNSKIIYDTVNFKKDNLNIAVLHGQTVGYKSDKTAENISLPRFSGKNIDYLALGHIHTFSEGKLDERGKFVYSGCLEGRGFDETGEKGFVLIEENGGELSYDFKPFSARKLYEYEYLLDETVDFYTNKKLLMSKLSSEINDPNGLLKVILKGSHKVDFILDAERLESELSELFFYAKVYDKTSLDISLEDYATDKSLVGEFVRCVLKSDLTDEEKKRVISCGIDAVKGEEI